MILTLLTPLTALPILFGLVFGIWGCLSIITGVYGLDLGAAVPLVHSEPGGVGEPLLLFGVAVFALVRGHQIRKGPESEEDETPPTFGPLGWLERFCIAGAGLGLVALPYWLALPIPEIWAVAGGVLAWFGWRKMTG